VDPDPDTGNGTGPALRLVRRSPRLAVQLTRSLLAERRRVRRERGERLPLRRLLAPGGVQELARHGGRVDPGLALRALEHLIDPEWTKEERFRVSYELSGEGGGRWTVIVDTAEHGLYPGFQRGFSLVEQDEHRHIAFGVRFLRDVCEERPERRDVALRTLERLLPRAAEVFAPPEAESPREFVSYGYHSSQVYGFAYMALRRRMRAIGIEIPPPERLMPGPIDPRGVAGRPAARPGAACGRR
jgi:hypothetical protein